MDGIISLISTQGIWVFLTGFILCLIIGVIKTPIKAKILSGNLEADKKLKRGQVFDHIVFFSTFIMAFIGAVVLYAIMHKDFDFVPVFKLSLKVWLALSLVYGIWKKLGIKRFFQFILKLFVKDKDQNGEISLEEAVETLKKAWKDGKLDIEGLIDEVVDNATENLEETLDQASEGLTPNSVEKTIYNLHDNTNEALVEIAKDGQKIIKF